jgi:SnoaL-like domain
VISIGQLQQLVAGWWFDYDQANFDAWADYFTADVHFSCRSDSRATPFEEFVTADVSGRDEVLAWNRRHRNESPYPLRHNGTNIHIVSGDDRHCGFRSYIFVSQVVAMAVTPLASGIVAGTVRDDAQRVRFSELRVILDFTDSQTLSAVTPFDFA